MKTHLSRALVDAKRKAEVEENNARKIYHAGESKSFYRGVQHQPRVFPTIIIIRRDNEAREKDGSTKRTYLRPKQSFVRRLCRIAIKEGIAGARWENDEG